MQLVPSQGACPAANPTVWPRSPRRVGLAAAGLACFGLGFVGIMVPGMPTTVFVLIGSFLLTRSCPWLERKLVGSRLFRPYAKYLDPLTPMPPRARAAAIGTMWTAITISCVVLMLAGTAPWVPAAVVALGLVGTWAIARFRRHVAAPSDAAAAGHTLVEWKCPGAAAERPVSFGGEGGGLLPLESGARDGCCAGRE